MRKISLSTLLASFVLASLSSIFLAGCGSSDDGPMLSDEEKIQKTHEGRAAYEKAMGGGRPPAASTTAGTPSPATPPAAGG